MRETGIGIGVSIENQNQNQSPEYREYHRPHGNVDRIMGVVKCVAVATEVGIVGPHAHSNKPS